LALEASPANLRHLEEQREVFLAKATNEKQKAAALAARIEALPCTLARPAGENEKLFGSVTTMDLPEISARTGDLRGPPEDLFTQPDQSPGHFFRLPKTSSGSHCPNEGECCGRFTGGQGLGPRSALGLGKRKHGPFGATSSSPES